MLPRMTRWEECASVFDRDRESDGSNASYPTLSPSALRNNCLAVSPQLTENPESITRCLSRSTMPSFVPTGADLPSEQTSNQQQIPPLQPSLSSQHKNLVDLPIRARSKSSLQGNPQGQPQIAPPGSKAQPSPSFYQQGASYREVTSRPEEALELQNLATPLLYDSSCQSPSSPNTEDSLQVDETSECKWIILHSMGCDLLLISA